MDNEILELLKSMQSDIKGMQGDIKGMQGDIKGINTKIEELFNGQNRIEKKLDAVVEQTADLTEFRTETKESTNSLNNGVKDLINKFDKVEKVTMQNSFDVAYLRSVK